MKTHFIKNAAEELIKDIPWTVSVLILLAWCAIMVSIVHTGGKPFEIFQPPLWAMPLAILSWIGVSWLVGRAFRHVFMEH